MLFFENYGEEFEEIVDIVRDRMYIDDLVTGEECTNEIKKLKSEFISLFQE